MSVGLTRLQSIATFQWLSDGQPQPQPQPQNLSLSLAKADLPESNAAVLRPVAQARCVLYADQLDRLALERRVH